MDPEILIPIVVSIVGATASIITANWQRRKMEAEANKLETDGNAAISNAAIQLVDPLRQEIATLRAELAAERAARKAEAEAMKRENMRLRDKNRELQTAYNLVSQDNASLTARVRRLEQRLDTGELTPPPHTLPNWQEPPPPDSDDPADWN